MVLTVYSVAGNCFSTVIAFSLCDESAGRIYCHRMCCYDCQIEKITRWDGHVVHVGYARNACSVLVEKPAGRRPFERFKRRLDFSIERNLKKQSLSNVN